jgi:putative autotransporter adhesin-like protein
MSKSKSLLALFAMVIMSGCYVDNIEGADVQLSGRVLTIEKDLAGFTSIEAGYAFDVEIRQADTFDVVLEIDEALIPYLDVSRRGDSLSLLLEPGHRYELEGDCLLATVYMPTVENITLSGASRLSGHLGVETLEVDMSDASAIELSGSASDLQLTESGACAVELSAFPVANAKANLSGASIATINVTNSLRASASGASHLTYLGNPADVDVSVSDAARIDPM